MFSRDRMHLLPALLLLVLTVVLVALATSTVASTNVDSDITTDTVWDISGSPYYVKTNIVVNDGVTLTIKEGVEVGFTGYYYLDCGATGRIVAAGTADSPINFTSTATEPAVGDWDHLATGAGGTLSHCNILHATIAAYVNNGGTVSDCDVRACTTGFVIESTGATVQGTHLWGLGVAIGMRDASNVLVEGCVVENCDEGINFLGTTQNSLVDGCWINSSTQQGVGIVATGGNNRVWNTYISRSPIGILMRDLMSPTAQGNIHIFNCTIEQFADTGISMESVYPVNPVEIQRCHIWDGSMGILMETCGYIEVTECTLRENVRGLKVNNTMGYTTSVHKNNFIKNNVVEAVSTDSEVLWDLNGFGNYWWVAINEYGFTDGNGDGIADTAWSLTGTQKDNYPLMEPVDFEDPVAEAGDDQTVRQRRTLDLDGSGSTDDTLVANYTWTIEQPDEDMVVYGKKVEGVRVEYAGVFTVTLTVRDHMGKVGVDTFTLTVTDGESPKFEGINTPERAGAGTVLVFSANISDNVGVAEAWVTYRFGLSGQNNRLDMVHKGGLLWENGTFIPITVNQKVYYTITAKDAENNIQRTGEKEIIVADITPPDIVSALPANVTTGDLNWINMTITDNRLMDKVTLEYWFGEDGEHATIDLTMQGETWVSQIDVPRDAPSPMYLVFNATDVAGNWNETDALEVPVADNDPPVLNIDNTSSKLHKGETAEIRAVINDNIGIESAFVEVRYPPETSYEATPLLFDGTEWVGVITVKSTGVRIHYHFRITDTSGNVLLTEDTERLMLSQRPHITTVAETEAWEGQLYSVDFDAEDPDNEDYEHQWSMTTNATWLQIDPVEGIVSGTPEDAQVGWYWVNISVMDPDGVDDWLYYEVVVNDVNAPPEVSIVSPPDEQKVGTILRVSGRATDDLDEIVWVQVRVDDGEWEEVTGTKTWSYEVSVKGMDPGMHFFYAKSYDGISESTPVELAFVVPKKDTGDDSPGFGALVTIAAVGTATLLGLAVARRRMM